MYHNIFRYINSRVEVTGRWLDIKFDLSDNGSNEIVAILEGHKEGISHLEAILHMVSCVGKCFQN
jgi:hypothetical protein